MLQRQNTCVVHTEATYSRDVAGTFRRDKITTCAHMKMLPTGTCPRDMLQLHVPSCELIILKLCKCCGYISQEYVAATCPLV